MFLPTDVPCSVPGEFPVYHIISPCSLTAAGLAGLIDSGAEHTVFLHPVTERHHNRLPADEHTRPRQVVVFIPDNPYWLLKMLQKVAFLLGRRRKQSVLLLSRCPSSWLWQTLQKLVPHPDCLSGVRAASSDLPCCQLQTLLNDGLRALPPLEVQARAEMQVWRRNTAGLTPRELDVMLDSLRGGNVHSQARVLQLSIKTLYGQRRSGQKKMTEHEPQLCRHFSGGQTKSQDVGEKNMLSLPERELMHAIHAGQIFPVFQPVVDTEKRLRGFEMLCRWSRDGKILLPGEFLPGIHSRYAWLLLTAFILREAVRQINERRDECYFSVNIPAVLAGDEGLERMLMTARRELHHVQDVRRLSLEVSEITDLNDQDESIILLRKLQTQGFRIMLDDCFSQGSVIFPVRTFRFSDYKLDMSVVNDLQHDDHACSLVKSLVYYCGLTGGECIAEGVDSPEKFRKLKELGVHGFQGYLISPPVTECELGTLIMGTGPR